MEIRLTVQKWYRILWNRLSLHKKRILVYSQALCWHNRHCTNTDSAHFFCFSRHTISNGSTYYTWWPSAANAAPIASAPRKTAAERVANIHKRSATNERANTLRQACPHHSTTNVSGFAIHASVDDDDDPSQHPNTKAHRRLRRLFLNTTPIRQCCRAFRVCLLQSALEISRKIRFSYFQMQI